MLSIFSSLLGVVGGVVPTALKMVNASIEHKQEIELMKLQAETQKELGSTRLEQTKYETSAKTVSAAYRHDTAMAGNASQWVVNIRALCRPFLSILVLGTAIYFVAKVIEIQPVDLTFVALADFVFAGANGVLWFWFTGRAVQKHFGEK